MLFRYNNTSQRLTEICNYLRTQSSEKDVIIETPKRSRAQNRTFYDNVHIIADYLGNEDDDQKFYLLKLITQVGLLQMVKYKEIAGEAIQVYRSTTDLNRKEFMILMDFVFNFGQNLELQMHIPGDLYDKFDF